MEVHDLGVELGQGLFERTAAATVRKRATEPRARGAARADRVRGGAGDRPDLDLQTTPPQRSGQLSDVEIEPPSWGRGQGVGDQQDPHPVYLATSRSGGNNDDDVLRMKPPSPHVSAIVVAHDSGPALDRCLRSVRAELDREGLRGEILLVDNASRDGAVHRAADAHTGLVVLRNETNRGFGAAVNQGFRASSGEHVLLLNPDAELAGGALGRLYRTLQDHPRAALAAPRLTLPDGSRQESPRRFYDLGAVLARRTGWGRSGPGQESRMYSNRSQKTTGDKSK